MIARLPLAGAVLAAASSVSASSMACPVNELTPLSCHNTTSVNTCCHEYPGGQMLLTQFWDTAPSTGPADSWTVHGLWCVASAQYWLLLSS